MPRTVSMRSLPSLRAQVADVDVDDVGAGVVVVAPHVGEQLLAAEHLAGVAQEHLEHRELARAELDRARRRRWRGGCAGRARRRRPRSTVALGRAALAQAHAHARQQLLEAERLGDVVVGAALEAGDLDVGVVARAEDHHRHPVARGAHVAQHAQAVLARQPEVEHEQVEVGVAGEHASPRSRRATVVVVKPLARRPFSRNEASRGSSSAIRMRFMAGRPPAAARSG